MGKDPRNLQVIAGEIMIDQAARAEEFRRLHEIDEPFLIPNPWDEGTTRLLDKIGFAALATTSLGVSITVGRRRVTREMVLANCAAICEATELPVNADLENGFADDPVKSAECVALAFRCGAVGASIEDATKKPTHPIYDFNHAVERIQAAVEVAHAQPSPMLLTARAENQLYGANDLDDTIQRLQAFEKAGADVLYAPGLHTLEEIKTVTSALGKPVNVVMGFADPSITLPQLAEAGVKRVSIGGALCRLSVRAFIDGAKEMKSGRFTFVERMAATDEIQRAFKE